MKDFSRIDRDKIVSDFLLQGKGIPIRDKAIFLTSLVISGNYAMSSTDYETTVIW